MSDTQSTEKNDHGEIVSRPGRRISWAWLFPVLAAAATAWLFWSNWRAEGPEIEISFDSAPGIQAGKTPLIYRGVVAGKVTKLRLDRSLDKVVLSVRLKEFAADLAREGTLFWIDQPEIALGNTTGLDALIQGNSLQARMGDGAPATRFEGAAQIPLTPLESPALVLKLRAPGIPSLDRGSPLYYRGVQVGVVESKALDENGRPYLRVVVEKEFAGLVRNNARFWPVPATSFKVGPSGIKLNLMGLKAILLGALEFEIFGKPGAPATDDMEFVLHADKVAAQSTGEPVSITLKSGQGLSPGETEVRHLGIPVGFVETAVLAPDNQSVTAVVRFQPQFEHLHPAGTVFTVVRPSISLKGVTGLETVVGGVYIDCVPGTGTEVATSFIGQTNNDEALVAETHPGDLRITLRAKSLPAIGDGAPVYYRGLVAGKVIEKSIDSDGTPALTVLIHKEYAQHVATNSRFWNVPALALQAGPGVLNLDVAGLESLLYGGVAFDVFDTPKENAKDGARFDLALTEAIARASSPAIRIDFDNGQGLLAGRTQARYLGVPVGIVESLRTKDDSVEATVRFNPGYDFLRREGSKFSVVRLNVSLNGVSGLETVVSGVYIDCVPAGGGKPAEHFRGVSLAKEEFAQEEEKGFEVVVTADRTNIAIDAPVTYRGLVVGKVGRKILADDGKSVGLCVVIDRAYAGLIRENTKFWDAGGVKVSLGFFALKVQTQSLDAIARGGIAFATPDELGAKVEQGHEFPLQKQPRPEWLKWSPALPPAE